MKELKIPVLQNEVPENIKMKDLKIQNAGPEYIYTHTYICICICIYSIYIFININLFSYERALAESI